MRTLSSAPAPANSTLVLFDIDGTLIRRAGPHHREALVHAARKIFGVDTTTEGIPVQGMLDTDILAQMLRRAGIPGTKAKAAMPDLMHRAETYYLRQAPRQLGHRVCPGARSLLHRLHRRQIPMVLVTGNFAKIGWRKVEAAGLKHYFRDGAFAGMAPTRAGLAKMAIAQAREQGWVDGKASRIVLVGDSPADVEAARRNRIPCIAVSSGITTHEELAALNPDILVRKLSEVRLAQLEG